MTVAMVQARLSADDAAQLDADRAILGLATRSEALREGLRLLHREARYAALGRDYDIFYGTDVEIPIGDLAASGDVIAADSIAHR